MERNDSGFSFGGSSLSDFDPVMEPSDAGEIDAIEVSGEPVSRREAKDLGLVSYETVRRPRSATTKIRLEQLPGDIEPEFSRKLEQAWNHLKRNETDEALTLAQEVVWKYPSLVAAKSIIARCFINRKEYEKSLAILQAIPEADRNAECHYYVGLCQSRLGRVREAIEALKASRSTTEDPLLRKRASDLLQHLQGKQAHCPICGKKTLYDSMVEVGNQTICVNCARGAEEDDGDDEDNDVAVAPRRKRRKRLRPPLTKADILIRLMFVGFIFCLMAFGVYLLHIVSPSYYGMFRSYLPRNWHWLPPAAQIGNSAPPPPESRPPEGPQVIPTMLFDSPAITTAVVGVEIRRHLRIPGMETRNGVYSAKIVPVPDGPHSLDPDTQTFTWTPSASDAGESFTLTFDAVFNTVMAQSQVNQVRVSPGPTFRQVGEWQEANPAAPMFIVVEDVTGDSKPELLLTTGNFSNGSISVFQEDAAGFSPLTTAKGASRPVGVGVIQAGSEKWVSLADYWGSRIRFYALRNDNLSEMSVSVELPGRPLLAAFDRELSLSAALCQDAGGAYKVVAYRQEGQQATQIGGWRVPDDVAWKRLLVAKRDADEPPLLVAVGADFSNTVMMLEVGAAAPVIIRHGKTGSVIDAALSRAGDRLYCLVDGDGGLRIETVDLKEYPAEGRYAPIAMDFDPALCGMGVVGLSGAADDLVVLSASRAGIAFSAGEPISGAMHSWPLPSPGRIFGQVAAFPRSDGAGEALIFVDESGAIQSMILAF